jgi:hypothetical protein
MTGEWGSGGDGGTPMPPPPAPLPPNVAPAPLPLGIPARPRNNAAVVAVVAAVIVVCSCCCASQVVGPLLLAGIFGPRLDKAADTPAFTRAFSAPEGVWADGGRYALVQSADASGNARLVVWERSSGRVRVVPGYRLVTAEEASAVAWVVRDSLDETPDPYAFQRPLGTHDEPVPAVASLRLADASVATAPPGPALWAPWPSGSGYTALFTVRPELGAFPSVLTIRRPDGTSVRVPPGPAARTFRPLGWSPSGRYFGLLWLVPPGDGGGDGATLTLSIVDAQTGRSSTWERVLTPDDTEEERMPVFWDGRQDRLWWFRNAVADPDPDLGGEASALVWIGTDGVAHPTAPPSAAPSEGFAEVAGTDANGVVCVTGSRRPEAWLVGGARPELLGGLSVPAGATATASRYSETGGIVYTVEQNEPADLARQVFVADPALRRAHTVWTERVPNPVLRAVGLDRFFKLPPRKDTP